MECDKEKRKDNPRRRHHRQIIAIGLVVLACAVFGIIYYVNTQRLPTLPPPLDSVTLLRAPAFPDITLNLDITPIEPVYMVNKVFGGGGLNMAVGHPTFASSSDLRNPASATDGMDSLWESDSSTGTWLYIDLETPQTFRIIIPSLAVETGDWSVDVETYFIASDDLKTWRVLYQAEKPLWTQQGVFLPESVTARYVGLYAQDWKGARGSVVEFMVLP